MSDNQGLRDGSAGADLELPSVNGGKRDDRKKAALAVAGGRAAGLARVMALFSSPLGRILPLVLTFGIAGVNTLTMNARNAALAAKAQDNSGASHVAEPLPSDLVVQKMRQTANLDNEALVASKNGKYGMHFGDYDPAAIQQQKDAEAAAKAAASKPASTPAAQAKAPPAPDRSKLLSGMPGAGGPGAGAANGLGGGNGFGASSGFGSNSMGAAGFNNSLNPFGNSLQSSAVRNAAQQGKAASTAAGAQGKSAAMAASQNVSLGAAARGKSAGKLNAMGQLNAAASLSKNAKGMANYQASNTTAGHAFDGSTAGGSIAGLGAGGGAVGVGGAGLGTADVGATPAGSGTNAGGGAGVPNLQAPTGTPDQSCNGASPTVTSASEFQAEGGDPDQYPTLVQQCQNQATMKSDQMWLMGLAVGLWVIYGLCYAAQKLLEGAPGPWSIAAAAALMVIALALMVFMIVKSVEIIVDMARIMGQTPSLKTGAIFNIVGAGIVIAAVGIAFAADAEFAAVYGSLAVGLVSMVGGMVGGGSSAPAGGGGGAAPAPAAAGGSGGGSGGSNGSSPTAGAGGISTSGPTIGTSGAGSGGTTQVGAKL